MLITFKRIFLVLSLVPVSTASVASAGIPPPQPFFINLNVQKTATYPMPASRVSQIFNVLTGDSLLTRCEGSQRDCICIYLCNKDPSLGGNFCGCDQYPMQGRSASRLKAVPSEVGSLWQ